MAQKIISQNFDVMLKQILLIIGVSIFNSTNVFETEYSEPIGIPSHQYKTYGVSYQLKSDKFP